MSQERKAPGRAMPVGSIAWIAAGLVLAALSAPASAQFPAPARPPKPVTDVMRQPTTDLPSAKSILDRHIAAIGGREAILSHTSTHAKGTLSMPSAGLTGSLEILAAKPNKSLMRISLAGVGEISEGFDGSHGWSLSPITGPMLLEGKQLEERRFDSEFYAEASPEKRYVSMTTLERTDFDGRPCYKLKLVRPTGGEDLQFFDIATGLKAGSVTTRETQMGTVTGTTIESEYKKFGNLLHATSVKSQIGQIQQVITITSTEYDNVQPAALEMPAQIKALVK